VILTDGGGLKTVSDGISTRPFFHSQNKFRILKYKLHLEEIKKYAENRDFHHVPALGANMQLEYL